MFANRVQAFNRTLYLTATLPQGIGVLNPFREADTALRCSDAFYDQYYADNQPRRAMLGINPGRFGGGLTGVPFTDFKRLQTVCGIDTNGLSSHEPSSEFIYHMIAALGGANRFYQQFYINSVCPLGFIVHKGNCKWVNYNYYDDKALFVAVKSFIVESIRQQIEFGLQTDVCFCLGKKNTAYLNLLNEEFQLFETIIELPHPRYIVQYKRKEMAMFIELYKDKLGNYL